MPTLFTPMVFISRLAYAQAESNAINTFLIDSLKYFQTAAITILAIILIFNLISMAHSSDGSAKAKSRVFFCIGCIGAVMLLRGIIGLIESLTGYGGENLGNEDIGANIWSD